jgi:hypothetical protein
MLGHWRLGAYLDLRPSVVAWRGGLVVVLVALVFVGGGRRRGREVGVRRRGRVGGGCHGEVLGGAGGGGEGASAAADGADASWDWEAVGLGLDAASWDRGWPRFGSARGGWRGDAREKA